MNSRHRGNTTVAKKALVSACGAVAAEAFSLCPSQVKTSLADCSGKLGIEISVPAKLPPLHQITAHSDFTNQLGGSLFELAHRARAEIIDRAGSICGAEIGTVNINFTGTCSPRKEVRVR